MHPEPLSPPAARYAQRLEQQEGKANAARARQERCGNLRLLVVAVGLAWLLLQAQDMVAVAWGWAVVAAFIPLVVLQGIASREEARAGLLVRHYRAALARMQGTRIAGGEDGLEFAPADHPYALDLDVLGPNSLHERIVLGVTHAGSRALARMLLSGAPPPTCIARRQALEELSEQLDLREDWLSVGSDVARSVRRERLGDWNEGGPAPGTRPFPAPVLALALFQTALTCAATTAWALDLLPFRLLALALLLHATFLLLLRRRVDPVLKALEAPAASLALLARLLEIVEQGRFEAPLLQTLRARLPVGSQAASVELRRLERLAAYAASRRNPFFLPISGLLCLGLHLASRVEAWRTRIGAQLEAWLGVVGEFEALLALAAYAFERPDDCFPEWADEGIVDARQLAHPLLPASQAVRNDLSLGVAGAPRAMIVSGSNMSGKSTLLRALGTNVVLARAGAPVCARGLRLGPLAIGASLRVSDSLADGRSRFLAEVLRLKQIVDLLQGPEPVLFLLDELLQGTNSHDREIGARMLVRGLLDGGAMGLLTTHDLALAAIADSDPTRVANVHLEDSFEDGRLAFDYRLRPGVVRRSNALELMRSVGLDVGPQAPGSCAPG